MRMGKGILLLSVTLAFLGAVPHSIEANEVARVGQPAMEGPSMCEGSGSGWVWRGERFGPLQEKYSHKLVWDLSRQFTLVQNPSGGVACGSPGGKITYCKTGQCCCCSEIVLPGGGGEPRVSVCSCVTPNIITPPDDGGGGNPTPQVCADTCREQQP
jgi:hypothetical protein